MDVDQQSIRERTQPFLRWAGSKRKSLNLLGLYWNSQCKKYIEPFMGSASLFFFVGPSQAVLGDINAELIQAFRAVRRYPRRVFDSLRPRPVRSDYYYCLREQNPSELTEISRAARFIYLNRFCFNGLYRTNCRGDFNVPYSGDRTGGKPTRSRLVQCARALRTASLHEGDFEAIVRRHTDEGDFVYLDPPYATRARRIFREYAPATFTTDDLERLARVLQVIATRGATFVLSYAFCPEVVKLLSGWNHKKVFVQRNIAGFAGNRRVAAEILVTNAGLR